MSLMLLGIIVPVTTPVLRAVELALNYLWQRDKLYAGIALVVLMLMLFGMILLPALNGP